MARENPGWGYDRIVGALANLGHRISDQTVCNILKRHGIFPARKRRQTDCILVELDDVAPLETRVASGDFPEEFIDTRRTAADHPNDAVFGGFHIWDRDDSH